MAEARITTEGRTTGITRGMAAITARVVLPMEHMAVRTMLLATTLRPEPLRAADQFRDPTDGQQPDKRTTLTPVPMGLRVKTPMALGIPEVRRFQGTARP